MIRLSFLQFRAQAATAAAALAVFAVILAASGPHLFGIYDRSGIAACQAHGNCLPLATGFVNKLGGLYTVFYFIGIGLLLLVPAMAATLATFLFIQIAWPIWARPHLIPPAHKSVALTAAIISNAGLAVGPGGSTIIVPSLPGMAGDWIIATQNIGPADRPFNVNSVSVCQGNTPQACLNTLSSLHLRAVIAYQPASRFWVFQWYETGIFLAASVLLAGFCFWWIRSRRLSL